MSLSAARQAIADTLAAALQSAKVQVGTHGGRFGTEDLRRYSAQAPAVRIACLALRSAERRGGTVAIDAAWAAYIVTRASANADQHSQALDLAETLAKLIPDQDWGVADASQPRNIRGDNLYSTEIDKSNVALWAISWQQTLTVELTDESTLDIFATFHADQDMAPADGDIDISQTTELPQE